MPVRHSDIMVVAIPHTRGANIPSAEAEADAIRRLFPGQAT